MIRSTRELTAAHEVACDVCIIGSGAGGAVLAAGLVARGLRVVMLEEGSHRTRVDFLPLQESVAYPMLYQERGARATADLAIAVLQGRTFGGGTVVNWTTCFRTPDRILDHWRERHGVEGLEPAALAPHFDAVEQRLSVHEWSEALVNPNNRVLLDGCRALGLHPELLRRNVKGCQNSGYCSFGCPFDAKQAMQVTYLADAVARGLEVWCDARAHVLEHRGSRVEAIVVNQMNPDRDIPGDPILTIRPRLTVSSCGAINGPALFLRSRVSGLPAVGRRTFLHPVVATVAEHDHEIAGWYGAPQSVACHDHIDRGPEEIGFFLESAPMHPMLSATAIPAFGAPLLAGMARLGSTSTTIALHVDGLLAGDDGGTVTLRSDGSPSLDYPLSPRLLDAFRESHRWMAKIGLAAGARVVRSLHVDPVEVRTEADLPKLDSAPYGPLRHSIFSAHQMGGLAMGATPADSVVDSTFKVHGFDNLYVVDGSVLPTSLGVNPSLTIYGLAHYATDHVARGLG